MIKAVPRLPTTLVLALSLLWLIAPKYEPVRNAPKLLPMQQQTTPCEITYLSGLNWVGEPLNGSGPVRLDRSNEDRPITIGGQEYAYGLGVHANSTIVYELNGAYQYFRTFVGVDDETGDAGSVQFEIYLDGALRLQSPVLYHDDEPYQMVVNVAGVNELKLVVNDGGDQNYSDHADWADARLEVCFDECTAGLPCDDGDPCTTEDVFDTNCNCSGTREDSDNDSVCDLLDRCPGADDRQDEDADGLPDACDRSPCHDTHLTDLAWLGEPINPQGPVEIDQSVGEAPLNDGGPLSINGMVYERGLGVHAHSEIVYRIDGQYEYFRAFVGVDEETGGLGSVQFEVYGDGLLLLQTPVLYGDDDALPILVDVTGVAELELVVKDGGDGIDSDHADWALPQLSNCTGYCAVGAPCDDGDPCTVNDVIQAHCDCAGTLADADQDGVCDSEDLCPDGNDTFDADLDGLPDACDDSPCGDVYLSDMNWAGRPLNGFGPVMRDKSNEGRPLTINGQTYERGLGAHAPSEITYLLNRQYASFSTFIGLDDEMGEQGSVQFEIYADGILVFQSGILTNQDEAVAVELDVSNVHEFQLVINDGGDNNFFDHANWADARFFCEEEPEEPCVPGAACDDGDVCTVDDRLDEDCNCSGIPPGGPGEAPAHCFDNTGGGSTDEGQQALCYIPNVFSPNDDGINDVFTVYPKEESYTIAVFQIFDRWGRLVFDQSHGLRDGRPAWDGTDAQGRRVEQGVYVFQISLIVPDEPAELLVGDLTVIW